MVRIREFRATRPAPRYASRVAALPYDVMNEKEARAMVAQEPLSFLAVDRAETAFPEGTVSFNDPEVYEKAGEILRELRRDGILVKDEDECFYVYRETDGEHEQSGVVVTLCVDDYVEGRIKKHELTRPDKEDDRVRHIEACGAHTGPIFVVYRTRQDVKKAVSDITSGEPLYDFTDLRGVRNTVWKASKDQCASLREAFGGAESLYIADGHHRNAAAVRVALKRREAGEEASSESSWYLAVLVAEDEVTILDYNRVVSTMNGLSASELIGKLSRDFEVTKVSGSAEARPSAKHGFAMYLEGSWYALRCIAERADDPVRDLDVSVLEERVLAPILGITDERNDPAIDFVGGARGYGELEKRVDSGEAKIAFALYPTSIADIMSVADAGGIMPPKSTWFEPKLLSGLFIHEF
ncbi:MAG: DUF1015 domain-containing protein [Eubacteriaceae bacterium]|nr:DUF1015 domain-containing protein [Eubacteriaceae bacterium]